MATATTNVIGYFNPNDYPLQIVIAEHNTTLMLNPRQYIVDRNGKLVNDPILDNYVGKGRLSRASDPKKNLDIVRLQPVNRQPTPGLADATYQHPVLQAQGFQRDAHGQTVAIAPQHIVPQPAVAPPASYNPVKAMSVEQAKRLRLIKPTKPVPEDYGVTDTAGAPIAGEKVPEIKYAHDTTKEVAPPPPVTAEPMTEAQAALVNNIAAAQKLNPEGQDFADAAAAQAVASATLPEPQLTPQVAPPPPPSSTPLLERLTRKPTAPPIPANPQPTQMIVADLPEPQVAVPPPPKDEDEGGIVVEEELGRPQQTEAKAPPADALPKQREWPCPLCPNKQPLTSAGYLRRHIERYHGDRAPALLAQLGLA